MLFRSFRGAQGVTAVDQIDDRAETGEVGGFLAGGVTAADENTVRVIKFLSGNLQKFKCPNEDIEKCLDEYKSDKLQAYYKSEAIPETNNDPVKVIVGNNFKELVLDSDKHVLLEAYAPWCGHCKTLAPIWEEVGQALAGNSKILLVKVDSTENEIPGVSVQGFPTLKFYKAGQKDTPIDFAGERTKEGIIGFLKEQTGGDWTDL